MKEKKSLFQRDVRAPMVTATLFTTAEAWRQPECPWTDEWIKTICYIYAMEYCSAIKEKEILPFMTTWVELEALC